MTNPANANSNFHGVWIDALVPLNAELNIDEVRLVSHLRNLSAKGFEKFVLFGFGGEGASFSIQEKLSTLKRVIAEGVEPGNLCMGVSTSALLDGVTLIRQSHDKGVKRFLICPPLHHQSLVSAGATDYFEQLIQRVGPIDWQLYIHQLGGSADLPETSLAELFQNHSEIFSGIVDQDSHINHTMDLMKSFSGRVQVIPTHEPNYKGLKPQTVVSVMANFIPNVVTHVLANDMPLQANKAAGMKVRLPDERVLELEKFLSDYPAIAAMKLMMAQHHRQEEWELVRPPQARLGKEAKELLMKAFKTFNLAANE
jgi:dihydrodipicolinate synthase/N-acetylneuraminate lyase